MRKLVNGICIFLDLKVYKKVLFTFHSEVPKKIHQKYANRHPAHQQANDLNGFYGFSTASPIEIGCREYNYYERDNYGPNAFSFHVIIFKISKN